MIDLYLCRYPTIASISVERYLPPRDIISSDIIGNLPCHYNPFPRYAVISVIRLRDHPSISGTDQFVIVHYADKVSYLCHGFIAKNLDAVNESHINLLKTSSVILLSSR